MPTRSHKTTPPEAHPIKATDMARLLRDVKTFQITVNGVSYDVTADLDAAVRRACETAGAIPDEMTTTQAAEYLDVSRPFVVKLIKQKKLPCRMVGTHRRIPTVALRAYKESTFQNARSAADEMTREAQDMGLYDLEGPHRDKR